MTQKAALVAWQGLLLLILLFFATAYTENVFSGLALTFIIH